MGCGSYRAPPPPIPPAARLYDGMVLSFPPQRDLWAMVNGTRRAFPDMGACRYLYLLPAGRQYVIIRRLTSSPSPLTSPRAISFVWSPSSATFQALRGRLDMVLKFPAKEREAADLLAVPAGPPLTAHDTLP